jgi:hypothetical protein
MEAVVVEHHLPGKVATPDEDHPRAISVARENPTATAFDQGDWGSVPIEELAHSAERVACKAELREFRIQSVNSRRSGQLQ